MSKIKTEEALEALFAEFEQNKDITPTEIAAWERWQAGWRPKLNPLQLEGFQNKRAKYKLYDGERGSGKTQGAVHELVEHCFLNLNAVAYIVVREVGQSKDGGAWDKLNNVILPSWKNGNRNPETGEKYDDGIGLVYSSPRYDPETKKPYVWIQNRFGGGSLVICFSLPVGSHVEDKIKGREPSFIMVDEAQTCEGDTYFSSTIQQLGRRHNITANGGQQPVIFCANPDGPSHWLYKRFFINPVNNETGEWNDDYARYHIPIEENIHNLPPGYYDRVIESCRDNPIMFARMVRGEWIDMPSGEAMFKDVFNVAIHVKGSEAENIGLTPLKGHVIIVGYDLGPAHSSIHFLQIISTSEKMIWLVFDEINMVGQYMPYRKVVPKILGRMEYWDEKAGKPFVYEHISDNSAFNQVRTDGSFDVQEIERLSQKKIKLKEAPKGANSVAARMRILYDSLAHEEIVISATCYRTVDMLRFMETAPKTREYNPDAWLCPWKADPFKHVADSLTYPMIYWRTRAGSFSDTENESIVKRCG